MFIKHLFFSLLLFIFVVFGSMVWGLEIKKRSNLNILERKVSNVYVKEDKAYFALPELMAQLEVSALIEFGSIYMGSEFKPGKSLILISPSLEIEKGTIKEVLNKISQKGLMIKECDNGVILDTHRKFPLKWKILKGNLIHIYNPKYLEDKKNSLNILCQSNYIPPWEAKNLREDERHPWSTDMHEPFLKYIQNEIQKQPPKKITKRKLSKKEVDSFVSIQPFGELTGTAPDYFEIMEKINITSSTLPTKGRTIREALLMSLALDKDLISGRKNKRNYFWVIEEWERVSLNRKKQPETDIGVSITLSNWNSKGTRNKLTTKALCEALAKTEGADIYNPDNIFNYVSIWRKVEDFSAEIIRRIHFKPKKVIRLLKESLVLEKVEPLSSLLSPLSECGQPEVLQFLFKSAKEIKNEKRHEKIVRALWSIFRLTKKYDDKFKDEWKKLAEFEKDSELKKLIEENLN